MSPSEADDREDAGVDLPADVASLVAGFADAARWVAGVIALYAGGPLATGDFHPGVRGLDLVAVVEAPLDAVQQKRLRSLHTRRRGIPVRARLSRARHARRVMTVGIVC